MEVSDKKRVIPAIAITAIVMLMIISLMSYYSGPDSVDVDCLIDSIETANLTEISSQYGKGVINENWKIKDIYVGYWNKHPKSRWAVKVFVNYYLKKCEK